MRLARPKPYQEIQSLETTRECWGTKFRVYLSHMLSTDTAASQEARVLGPNKNTQCKLGDTAAASLPTANEHT